MNSIWNKTCLCAILLFGLQNCYIVQEESTFKEFANANPDEWICSNVILSPQSGGLRIENGEYCIVRNDSVEEWTKGKDSITVGQRLKVRVKSSSLPVDVRHVS